MFVWLHTKNIILEALKLMTESMGEEEGEEPRELVYQLKRFKTIIKLSFKAKLKKKIVFLV